MNEDAARGRPEAPDTSAWEMPDAPAGAPSDGRGAGPETVPEVSAGEQGGRPAPPLPPVALIQLAREDRMAKVLARLKAVPQRRAVLVVPSGSDLLRQETDVARLRRWATAHGVGVALVSGDPRVRSLARRYGLPASASVGTALRKARRGRSRRARGESVAAGRQAAHRLYTAGGSWEDGLLLLILVLGAGLVGVLGTFLVMPQATVTVAPAQTALEQRVHLVANPAVELVDEEAAEIPAHIVETDLSGQAQVSTLARSDAPDAKATGEVVFVNRTNEHLEIPAGTVVATSAGTTIRFATTEPTALAPGMMSTTRAKIEALDPGPSGNVGPFLINRVADASLTLKIRVANEQPTQGGSVKQVGVVTAADKERLRSMLLQQLHQEAMARLGSDRGPEEFLPVESIAVTVLDETYDHLLGEATEFVGMIMRVHVEGIAFDLTQAQAMARSALEAEVPQGHTLRPQSFHAEVVEATVIPPSPDEGQYTARAQLAMKARGRAEATITPGRVISLIQGRPLSEARARLLTGLPLKQAPQLSVDPEWWGRVPWLPFRISVTVVSEDT